MHLSHPQAEVVPLLEKGLEDAFRRTTHLGVGAHQDDLEFMALHGILSCFQNPDHWFSGITCTDGAGSPRSGDFAGCSNEEMRIIRKDEQKRAAQIGEYAYIAQLGYPSSQVRLADGQAGLISDLTRLISQTRPKVLYTHNPFDRHPTHIWVFHAVIAALLELPQDQRPQQLIGCEVWRGLDWLPDSHKLVLDVSSQPELAISLAEAFPSQIVGGKRYDLAVEGRRRANASFHQSHQTDGPSAIDLALDLTPLILPGGPSIEAFVEQVLRGFSDQILNALNP